MCLGRSSARACVKPSTYLCFVTAKNTDEALLCVVDPFTRLRGLGLRAAVGRSNVVNELGRT